MSNEREAAINAIEEKYGFQPYQLCMLFGKDLEWAFQAGAAYQREQDKKLVRALAALIIDYDGEIHDRYDGTSMLDSRLSEINYAREALAAYKEQEKPND